MVYLVILDYKFKFICVVCLSTLNAETPTNSPCLQRGNRDCLIFRYTMAFKTGDSIIDGMDPIVEAARAEDVHSRADDDRGSQFSRDSRRTRLSRHSLHSRSRRSNSRRRSRSRSRSRSRTHSRSLSPDHLSIRDRGRWQSRSPSQVHSLGNAHHAHHSLRPRDFARSDGGRDSDQVVVDDMRKIAKTLSYKKRIHELEQLCVNLFSLLFLLCLNFLLRNLILHSISC